MGFESLLSTELAADVAVQLLGKGTILLALAGAASLMLRRGTPGQRHGVWSATFLIALLLPFLGAVLPVRELPLLPYPAEAPGLSGPGAPLAGDGWNEVRAVESRSGSAGSAAAGVPPAAGGETTPDPAARPLPVDRGTVALGFLLVWAAGALVLTVRLGGHWVRIAAVTASGRRAPPDGEVAALVRREADALGVRRRVLVVLSDRLEVPATGGLLRPVLILPRDAAGWPEARLRAVVLHELIHVRRWDLLAHQLAEVVRIVYWINPLLWWAHRRAADERERACDRAVVKRGISGPEYAGVLVEMARRCRAPSPALEGSLAMARPGRVLRRRVEAVLDGSVRRTVRGRAAVVAGLVLALGSLPLASVEVLAGPAEQGSLAAALTGGSVEVRLRAVRDLAGWCPGEPTRVLARALLGDEDPRVRRTAASGLGRHGQAGSLPALGRAASDESTPLGVRAAAVEAMGGIRHPATTGALQALVDSPEPSLRWLAIKNLGVVTTLPGPGLLSDLERALRHDPEPRNRAMAATVLHRLGCEDASRALDRARREDPSDLVRRRAADLLGLNGPESGVPGGAGTGLVGSPPTA